MDLIYLLASVLAVVLALPILSLLKRKRQNQIDPRGKCFFVTGMSNWILSSPFLGAANGIGKAIAQHLSSIGCIVFAADMNEAGLKATFGDLSNVTCIKLDVTSPSDVANATKIVESKVKKLDGIINSAGVSFAPKAPKGIVLGLIEMNVEEFVSPVMEINLIGTMRVNAALFPLLWAAKGSTIINVSSLAGRIATPGLGPYAMSKFALNGYSDCLRREMAAYGIRVVSLEPGFIRTELSDNIFDSTALDRTKTVLFAGRGDGSHSADATAKFPPPTIVVPHIQQILFDEPQTAFTHILIDTLPNTVLWRILFNLPDSIVDWFVEPTVANRRRIVEERWKQEAKSLS